MNDFLSALLGIGIVALSTWYLWKSRGEYLLRKIERGFPRSVRPIVRVILVAPIAVILLIVLIAAIVRK